MTMQNLHQLWPLRKPTTFRYMPQIAPAPFKTRIVPFPDNCTTRYRSTMKHELFTVWPQMTWDDLDSWDPEWPVCLAKGKVRCFYLYPSWQIGHDVYVDSKTINTAWNVQYVTRFCDKYDTVTLCYTQPNFVPALFLFYYFEPWLEALSDRVFHRMMLLWYLIMIKSSYWVWIKSIGHSDRVSTNIIEPLLKSRKPFQFPKWRFWR